MKVLCNLDVQQFHPKAADKEKVNFCFSWRADKVGYCGAGFNAPEAPRSPGCLQSPLKDERLLLPPQRRYVTANIYLYTCSHSGRTFTFALPKTRGQWICPVCCTLQVQITAWVEMSCMAGVWLGLSSSLDGVVANLKWSLRFKTVVRPNLDSTDT